MFTDAIMAELDWIYDRVANVTDGGSGLTATLDGFSETIYNWIDLILRTVAMPIAAVLLALFALLELHHAALAAQNSGSNSIPVEVVAKVLIKVALAKVALDSIALIMSAIYQLTTYLTSQVQSLMKNDSTVTYDLDLIRANVEALDFGMQLLLLIIGFVVFLITLIATLYAEIIIVCRFVEIYILYALSPIPAATLLNAEQSAIGKNFLKSFAAVCLQGTLIYLVLTFFPLLITADFTGDDAVTAVLGALGYSLVLLFSISATGKWAKSITGTG